MAGRPIHFSGAATAIADVDRFLAATDMKRGAYGAVLNAGTMPEANTARHVTITLTRANAVDNPLGIVTIAGTDLRNNVISEDITPLDNTTATGTKWFKTVTAQTGGNTWVTAGGADQISIGCGTDSIVAEGSGILHSIIVNTTAAGAITVSDVNGTLGIIKSAVAEGFFIYDLWFNGYLNVSLAAASDITVVYSQIP